MAGELDALIRNGDAPDYRHVTGRDGMWWLAGCWAHPDDKEWGKHGVLYFVDASEIWAWQFRRDSQGPIRQESRHC